MLRSVFWRLTPSDHLFCCFPTLSSALLQHSGLQVVAPQLEVLFNITSDRFHPAKDITIRGVTLTQARYTYMVGQRWFST